MARDGSDFDRWLREAKIARRALAPGQVSLLEAVFHFIQRSGRDYYSLRLMGHFLLHCQSGLKVAQIARLVGVSRSTASEQQGLSSKEVVQAAHHRMAGRPYGKLLPRYAGPIAQFLITHPKASRLDILDFIEATWKVRASRVALWHFMKKYGLDGAQQSLAAVSENPLATPSPMVSAATPPQIVSAAGSPREALPAPAENFFSARRGTRGRSSSCRPR